ncbi:MAG: hypothetical protein ACFFB8_12600 [Promethearchaeota archaeon]
MSREKRKYTSIAFPTDFDEVIQELIERSHLYRTKTEFYINAARQQYKKDVNILYRKKKILRKKVR